MALDLKEFVTREKGIGESKDKIEPHFGKDGKGKQISKQAAQSGPGRIFQLHLNRKMDCEEEKEDDKFDPVTLKAFKFQGRFNPKTTSTCPMVPKHHRTFGRPNLYETLSQELDRKSNTLHRVDQAESLMVKKDRIIVKYEKKEVDILNEFG